MLTMNPEWRSDAVQCLNHEYFVEAPERKLFLVVLIRFINYVFSL
jgi:hypothetical protein